MQISYSCAPPSPKPVPQSLGQEGTAHTLAAIFILFLPLSFALGVTWYRKYSSARRAVVLRQQIASLETLWRKSPK